MTETVTVQARCLRETERAILVDVAGEEFWIPKSAIHDDSEVYGDGHEGSLVVEEWVAKDRGFAP